MLLDSSQQFIMGRYGMVWQQLAFAACRPTLVVPELLLGTVICVLDAFGGTEEVQLLLDCKQEEIS